MGKILNSMRKKYLLLAGTVIGVIAMIYLLLFINNENQQQQLIEAQRESFDKQVAASELADSLNNVFFRARGAYAFRAELEYQLLDEALEDYNNAFRQFEQLNLSEEERELTNELMVFMEGYENEILPTALAFVEAGDYEGLQEYSSSGINSTVNEFLTFTKEIELESEALRDETFKSSINEISEALTVSSVLTFLLIGALMLFLWRLIDSIVKPIETLHVAAAEIQSGRSPNIEKSNRKDEIGTLTSSFISMTTYLQRNEEELQAQNEELTAQQEAMHEQQDQLAATLLETQETKGRLELFNDLNRVLSSTSNRYKFLDEMVQYMNKLYAFDQIMMYMSDRSAYSALNVSTAKIQQILEASIDQSESGLRVRKRLARPEEDSLHGTKSFVYDLTAEITGASGELIGIFRANRYGRPFEENECEEIQGLVQRMSIAFERLLAFDEIKYSKELTQDMLDNMTEGLQLVNPDGCLVQHNEALCKLLEVEPSEDEKVECEEWLSRIISRVNEETELRTFFEETIDSAFDGTRSIRYTLKTIDGSLRVFDVYGMSVYRDKQWTGTVFVHRDITRDYEVDKMKSELVSTVSHELRTPLSSVLGFAELLLTKEMKPEKQKRYIETIHKEAKRLTNLINDFLDLQRMEAGRQEYHMEEVKLNELVMEVLEKINIPSTHALIVRDEIENSMVKGDRERLTQVMTNLLNNAVKFSPQGGDILVKLCGEPGKALIVVQDQGIGIPDHEVGKLFQKFKRIDNSESRNIGGTGLGLAICKEIVDKHMGHIFVKSEEGKGSAFYVELPLINEYQSHTLATENTILVLEDDPSLALLIADELKSRGFSVVHHFQPERAVEALANQTFTGVVVDIMLGENLDGWDVIEQVRQQPGNAELPIVVSSALDEDLEKVQRYQVTKYLTKPYPPEKLSEIF
ncbi:histidine kinase [Jeotgalibacillus malaysiensis]|uniref:histidine kinase n=1 Tax=Jeotgalibacillus malaysiensis TaxID=1508404 RepID=A0A0B5AIR7_9BACL|nr:ATP-binding protein [Jeotgalibacillus malaysiensis]AJD89966.1 histidine kinase [Jeotgalibacillus malaysiensis]